MLKLKDSKENKEPVIISITTGEENYDRGFFTDHNAIEIHYDNIRVITFNPKDGSFTLAEVLDVERNYLKSKGIELEDNKIIHRNKLNVCICGECHK